jgi:hypothetical protein
MIGVSCEQRMEGPRQSFLREPLNREPGASAPTSCWGAFQRDRFRRLRARMIAGALLFGRALPGRYREASVIAARFLQLMAGVEARLAPRLLSQHAAELFLQEAPR